MQVQPPSFLATLSGLLATPSSTIQRLLLSERQPYVLTLLSLTILTLFAPILGVVFLYEMTAYPVPVLVSLCAIPLVTLLFFFFAETLFLDLLGMPVGLRDVVALVAYASFPPTIMLLFVYIFNYAAEGNLSIVLYLLTGNPLKNDQFLRVIPYATLIAHLSWLVVFYYGLRAYSSVHWLTSGMITICSAVPFYLSLAIAVAFAEVIRPGSLEILLQVVTPFGNLITNEWRALL